MNFANGAVAGVVTTLCTQPFDTIKTKSQSAKVCGPELGVESELFRNEDFAELYYAPGA